MDSFLRDLMAHAEWANAVFFATWSKSEARDHEDLRHRMDHIVVVLEAFLLMLDGKPPVVPSNGPPPSHTDLKARAEDAHRRWRDFAANLNPELLSRTVQIPFFPDPPCVITTAQALVQVALHTQHHRGQCMTRLKDYGGEPMNVDWIIWLWLQKPVAEWSTGAV